MLRVPGQATAFAHGVLVAACHVERSRRRSRNISRAVPFVVSLSHHADDEGRYNVPQVTAMNTPHDSHEPQPYRLPDVSVGDPDGPNPLEGLTWEELRDLIYEERRYSR